MLLGIIVSISSLFSLGLVFGLLLLLTGRIGKEEQAGPTDGEQDKEIDKQLELTAERMVAQVHCRAGRGQAKYQFEYRGLDDCIALSMLFGGDRLCKFGCLGLGSCVEVCPTGAAGFAENGLAVMDRELCRACGKCMEVCPIDVIRLIPYHADYLLGCNSTDDAKRVRKYCTAGCIGCKLCEKKSPNGGFRVAKSLAGIEYSSRGDRTAAAADCPPRCIYPLTAPSSAPVEIGKKSDQEPNDILEEKT